MAYYYLATSLIPLEFGDIPDLSFLELIDKYSLTLSGVEIEELKIIRLYFDLENIKQLLINDPASFAFDLRGNLSQKELKKALEEKDYFSQYVYDFLKQYNEPKEAVYHFPALLSAYYIHESENASGFLKQYLDFERCWRLIVTGYRAKKQKKDVVKELSFEESKDLFIASIFSQKDSPHFEAPFGYEEVLEMLVVAKNRPMHQYRHLAEFRFRKLREMTANKPFSLDYLLSYALRIVILEDLHGLNEMKGLEILNSILKDSA